MAFDTSGVAWNASCGYSTLSLLDVGGTALSGKAGYGPKSLKLPVTVATDAKCNSYVANQSSDRVTLVTADGSSFTDYVVG